MSHELFQQGGVGFVAEDAVSLEDDFAVDFARGGEIGFCTLLLVVFVMGGACFLPVFVVECNLSISIMESAFAHHHSALVVVGPRSVEEVVVESALDFDASIYVVSVVRSALFAVHVGVILTFAAIGHVHDFQPFDGVVFVNAVGVQQSVFEVPAEFAVAFSVFHLHLNLYAVAGVSEKIDSLAMLLFPFILYDRLGFSIRIVGGLRVGAGAHEKSDGQGDDIENGFCHNFLN